MEKAAFVLSGLLIGLGVWLLACGQMVQALLPYVGLIAFHLAGPGSYSADEYKIDLGTYYGLCFLCIAVGTLLCFFCYRNGVRRQASSI